MALSHSSFIHIIDLIGFWKSKAFFSCSFTHLSRSYMILTIQKCLAWIAICREPSEIREQAIGARELKQEKEGIQGHGWNFRALIKVVECTSWSLEAKRGKVKVMTLKDCNLLNQCPMNILRFLLLFFLLKML